MALFNPVDTLQGGEQILAVEGKVAVEEVAEGRGQHLRVRPQRLHLSANVEESPKLVALDVLAVQVPRKFVIYQLE